MRDLDRKDDQPALGAPIKKPDMPQPCRKVNESGTVRQKPDGMFETLIPPTPPYGFGWAFRSKS